MKRLIEEIELTINLMKTDIDANAHGELQNHLYSLLEMKRNEIQKRLDEQSWSESIMSDPLPNKMVVELYGQVSDDDKPLTTEELIVGGWWCADVSKDCANAFESKGLLVFNSDEWMSDGAHRGCVMDDCGTGVTRCFFDFEDKKQIHRIGSDFYWSEK